MKKCGLALFLVCFSLSFAAQAQDTGASGAGAGGAASITPVSPGEDTPQGLEEAKAQIAQAVEMLNGFATDYANVGAKLIGHEQLIKAEKKYSSSHSSCIKRQAFASGLCREETNPELQNTLQAANLLVSGISSFAVQDACSGMAKALNLVKGGLTLYTGACGGARAACEFSCSSAFTGLKELKAVSGQLKLECAAVPPGPDRAMCESIAAQVPAQVTQMNEGIAAEMQASDVRSIAKKNELCTYTYAQLLASAAAGIGSIVQSINQAKKCDEDSSAVSAEAAVPTDLNEKCALEQYAQTPECLCHFNPRTVGCSNGLEKAGSNAGGTGFGTDGSYGRSTADDGGGIVSLGGDGLSGISPLSTDSSGSGMAGAPMGGGSGIGGGGGGMAGAPAAEGEAARKGLDTNILSGAGGGGGGGWGGGFRSSSGAGNSKYRSYLPGGANDPNKLSGNAASKEVTGQGGKSNWEKVRDRYRDNNNTLLGH